MSGRWQAARRALLHRPTAWGGAVVVVCLAGGLLLGTARASSQGQDLRNRSSDLAGLVQDVQGQVDALNSTAAGLQQRIDAAASGDVSPQVTQARGSATGLAPAAGLTAVSGPAVRVTLTDAPRNAEGNYPAGVDPDDLVVHQQDVQAVVNALWAGGAEAMTIMDQRVVATSAVRCIGNTLLLQGRTYSPPFVITAIGDAGRMQSAVEAEPGVALYLQYAKAYGVGFSMQTLSAVTLPAYGSPLRVTVAQEGSG